MRPLATDTHDFPSIRRDGRIYVDKTMYIHRLVSDPDSNLFFVSRPRRFGKSLTVSALKAFFQGRRELFRGLAIDNADRTWETHPVIHFEFNDLTVTSIEAFEADLVNHLEEKLGDAGYVYDKSKPAHWNFGKAIETLSAAMAYGATERRIHENSYARCLAFLLASQGFDFTIENVQSNGRADIVAKHPAEACIFELKVDEPVDKAFVQIREKGYAEPLRAGMRPVWLIGLSFDSKTRRLVDFAAEKFQNNQQEKQR